MSMAPLPRDQWYDSRMVRAILNDDFVEAQKLVALRLNLELLITGSTFLHKCFQLKKWSMADFLIDHDAEVNSPDPDGFMPLHLAVRHRRPELVMKLMAKGADRHAKDKHERKPSDLPQAGMSIDWAYLSGNARLALDVMQIEDLPVLLLTEDSLTQASLELLGSHLLKQVIERQTWTEENLAVGYRMLHRLGIIIPRYYEKSYKFWIMIEQARALRTARAAAFNNSSLGRHLRGNE
jgi:hypothetical protein